MVEILDAEFGWFTFFLVQVAYLFLTYQKKCLLIKDIEIDVWYVLYLSLPKSF